MEKRLQTPSQTVGPYFAYGLTPEQYLFDYKTIVADDNAQTGMDCANCINLIGRVLDGNGAPIPDAMVELWVNDGINRHFCRMGTGTDPESRFKFLFPKPVAQSGHAPYAAVVVFMRGQLIHSYTRVYFEDEQSHNTADETLNTLPESRRHTLIAKAVSGGYQWDIHMQGQNETVFFDI